MDCTDVASEDCAYYIMSLAVLAAFTFNQIIEAWEAGQPKEGRLRNGTPVLMAIGSRGFKGYILKLMLVSTSWSILKLKLGLVPVDS